MQTRGLTARTGSIQSPIQESQRCQVQVRSAKCGGRPALSSSRASSLVDARRPAWPGVQLTNQARLQTCLHLAKSKTATVVQCDSFSFFFSRFFLCLFSFLTFPLFISYLLVQSFILPAIGFRTGLPPSHSAVPSSAVTPDNARGKTIYKPQSLSPTQVQVKCMVNIVLV